jgi:AbrB family looped-hinge helix DNA binding protein
MATIARSRLTSQGQISVPAEIRRRLGLQPGSILEWEERDGNLLVRPADRVSFEQIHRVLFPEGPPRRRGLKQLKQGIADHIRGRHARGRY